MKKFLLFFIIFTFWLTSVAFAYVYGGSNLGFSGYPAFNAYLSYNPSRSEVEIYVEEAKKYVENGNYDIQRIREAQNDAIRKSNEAVNDYNRKH